MEEKNCYQSQCGIEDVKIALFGDGNGNIGIEKMVKDMHVVFTQTNWAIKTMVKIFAGIGIVTGSIVGVIEFLKRMK